MYPECSKHVRPLPRRSHRISVKGNQFVFHFVGYLSHHWVWVEIIWRPACIPSLCLFFSSPLYPPRFPGGGFLIAFILPLAP